MAKITSIRETKSDETVVIYNLPKLTADLKDHIYIGMSEGKLVINLKFNTDIDNEDKIINDYLDQIKSYILDGINYALKRTVVYSKVEEEDLYVKKI